MPGRAAGHVRIVAWLVLAVAALWPFGAGGQCTLLSCDTTVNASIEAASEVDCMGFTVNDGEMVDISVVSRPPARSFQPSWLLFDRSGTPVNGPCGVFGPTEPNFACGPLAASGSPYGIAVRATRPGDTGPYKVRFERLTAAPACEDIPLTCAVPVNGTTDDPLDTDLFSFNVSDGEVIEISVVSGLHGGTVIDAAWELIDGTGNPAGGLCGTFGPSQLNFVCGPLAARGNPYRIKVGDDGAKHSGQYKVRFQRLTAAAACLSTELACGVAVNTAIADPHPDQCGFAECPVLETKLFSFSVNEGEHIAVTVEDVPPFGDHFSSGWRLLDRTGNPVAGVCGEFDSSQPNFQCGPLAAAGSPYQLEVGGVGDPVSGNARVLVNLLTSPCATECPGDCDGSQEVAITELVTLVNIALRNATVSACSPGDANRDGIIRIDELLTAVNRALNGCAGS